MAKLAIKKWHNSSKATGEGRMRDPPPLRNSVPSRWDLHSLSRRSKPGIDHTLCIAAQPKRLRCTAKNPTPRDLTFKFSSLLLMLIKTSKAWDTSVACLTEFSLILTSVSNLYCRQSNSFNHYQETKSEGKKEATTKKAVTQSDNWQVCNPFAICKNVHWGY